MSKKNFSLYILLFLFVFGVTSSLASSYFQVVERYYNNIKIKLNGKEIIPKDEKGNTVEPFIIDGTTYLPVRALANALNLEVNWDSYNNTVVLSDKNNQSVKNFVVPANPNNYAQVYDEDIEGIEIIDKSTQKVIRSTVSLEENDKIKFSVSFYPNNSIGEEITWSSSNNGVAKVNSMGTVTAKSEGTAKITATTTSGHSDTITVKVKSIPTPIANSQTKLEDKSYYEKYVKGAIESRMNSRGLLDSSITTSSINNALSQINSSSVDSLESAVYTVRSNSYYHILGCKKLTGELISYQKYIAIAQGLDACPFCNP